MTFTPMRAFAGLLFFASNIFAAAPTLELPSTIELLHGAPLHIPLNAFDSDSDALTFSVSNATALETLIPEANRSLELNVADFGTMTFELFEERAPLATSRIIELTEDGFYDGITFHRVIDDFVIQMGDPEGTGRGGSSLPDFDDQFHVDLLHSGPGVLAMAKSNDDTNNSQVYVTETAFPHLDFNHIVFGLLTDGEDVRDAISNTEVNFGGLPAAPVVIESARIINDVENGVLMLKALETTTGPIDVSVTVSDGSDSITETISVTISEDEHNHQPFLEQFPNVFQTNVNETLEFKLNAIDLEQDLIEYRLFAENPDVEFTIDDQGNVTVTPPADFMGELLMLARVGANNARDDQFFSINVVPEPSAGVLMLLGGLMGILAMRRRRFM